ncbi:hypothetical protein PHPALM_18870 [Phytophthora palmivora]|uniref:Uncharacterized protein n=1 Tax=Phytophthora palmivora TaxID=4796 RepID=A0A2P4XIP0_9STRA|nr:hypothetical protein PHPALM_18870 [Phytophthora palmivora]
MASKPPVPLVAVTLVFGCRPRFDGIDHVINTVSAYADSSVEVPLNKACKYGSVTLLDRIWNSTVDLEPNGWGLWSVRTLLRTYRLYGKFQFTLSLLAAIKINNVEVVRWLFEHFPDYGVRRKVVIFEPMAQPFTVKKKQKRMENGMKKKKIGKEEDGYGGEGSMLLRLGWQDMQTSSDGCMRRVIARIEVIIVLLTRH